MDQDTIDKLKQFAEEYQKSHQSTCPNCGYCPHCGRGGYYGRPYWEVRPQYDYEYRPDWTTVTSTPRVMW